MTRILFVCLGNICRSPTAEAVLRAKLSVSGITAHVDSAGTGDWHIGHPPHPPMIAAAGQAGYDLLPLRARQVTPDDFHDFDLILAADPGNLRDLERLRPTGNATPVKLLAPFADPQRDTIPDPYYTDDYAGALALIETACDGLVTQLQ